MRQPTDQEARQYKYAVYLKIDVKRTDGARLTDEENQMVLEMQKASEEAIGTIMAKHGSSKSKTLGREYVEY